MKKILVIPPNSVDPKKMKVRLIEIAQGLSTRYKVYLLSWHEALSARFLNRLWCYLSDLFKIKKFYKKNSLIMAEFPILHRPLSFALKFNSYFLKKIVNQEKIDVVLNGQYYMFDIPRKRSFEYIFDLADLPASGLDSSFDRFIHRQVKGEAQKAELITVVSRGLGKYVSENYNRQSQVVPNGAYIDKLRSVRPTDVDEIRNRYNLIGKWVIGYIGFMGSWVDIEFLVRVFSQLKKEITNAVLLLVGASPKLKLMHNNFSGEDIIITGIVEEDISKYFNCLDLAVLPHKKNLYQDLAFHIKLIEYTAARKIVVSSPLEEIKRLDFPNVILADLNIEDWVEAIKNAKSMSWVPQWDGLVEPYDWSNIINQLCNIIEQ